jgi:hypothetical protein
MRPGSRVRWPGRLPGPVAVLACALLTACPRPALEVAPSTCSQGGEPTTCLVAAVDRVDSPSGRIELVTGIFTRGKQIPLPGSLKIRIGRQQIPATEVRRLQAAEEARGEDWTPPLAAGIVYLWAKGTTPAGIRSGVAFLAESLPAGARVCPKSYGQHHYEMACLPAYHIAAGSLLDDQHPGQFVHFLKAARQSLREVQGLARTLAEEGRRPIQWLVLITDGRDHENGTEGEVARLQTRRSFGELGVELRGSGVWTQVISFPCPGDRQECRDNVEALVQTAGAAHFWAAEESQVEDRIRRAALAWLEMRWVAVDVPWSVRLLASAQPIWLVARVSHDRLSAPLGPLLASGRRRRGYAVLFALSISGLVLLLLGSRGRAASAANRRIYPILAGALSEGLSPRGTSRRLRGLLTSAECARFARLSSRRLQAELRRESVDLPELGGSAAPSFALETGRELREDLERLVGAAWLVLASGPRSGQTCAVPGPVALLGAGEGGTWLQDLRPQLGLEARHAEIATVGGRYFLRPLDGAVAVDGSPLLGERELTDGDRLRLGRAELVFKSVRVLPGT